LRQEDYPGLHRGAQNNNGSQKQKRKAERWADEGHSMAGGSEIYWLSATTRPYYNSLGCPN
jgi:hypothetical protein